MYASKWLSFKSVELACIRRTLPPPPEQAPETEPPDSHLKLKENTHIHHESRGLSTQATCISGLQYRNKIEARI